MLRMRPSLSRAKSVPLIGLSPPSGTEPPGEADVIAKTVGLADQREPEIRKALLHARDQRVDAVVAVAAHQGIDISCVRRPVCGEHLAPALCCALVPQIDIAVSDSRVIGHVALLRWRRMDRLNALSKVRSG